MKTTIIPAQITTVEDKIAGSLSLMQFLILISPIVDLAFIFVVFPPTMKLTLYKLIIILVMAILCIILSIRIKEKIVFDWLKIIIKFRLRPKYYLFDKNSLTNREIDIPKKIIRTKETINNNNQTANKKLIVPEIEISDLIKLNNLISKGKVILHYQFDNK